MLLSRFDVLWKAVVVVITFFSKVLSYNSNFKSTALREM